MCEKKEEKEGECVFVGGRERRSGGGMLLVRVYIELHSKATNKRKAFSFLLTEQFKVQRLNDACQAEATK